MHESYDKVESDGVESCPNVEKTEFENVVN